MANETRKRLHKALNDAGYNIGDYDEFDRRMNNADDRESFFNAVSNAGYNLGSREDFERKISPSKYKLTINGVDTPVSEREYMDFTARHPQKPQQTQPQESEQPQESFQTTIAKAQQAVEGVKTFDDFSANMQKRQGLRVPKRVAVGETGGLSEGRKRLNPETGELEQTYVTGSGNEYDNKAIAELEQRKIDERERNERWRREHPKEALLGDIDSQVEKLDSMLGNYEIDYVDADGRIHYKRGRADDEAINAIETARQDLKEARTRIERSQQLEASSDFLGGTGLIPFTHDWYNNWKNFGYGIWDTLQDPSLYDFGRSDLMKAGQYLRIKQKMENGEELTDQETAMALAGMSLAQAQQIAEVPHGYTAGATTMEMAPFMLQMAANPASGFGRAFARQAVRKFGRNGIKAVSARIGARVLGNIGEAAVLSNTLQAGSTAANILQRYTGDSFEYDDNGRLMIGHYVDGPDGQSVFVEGGKSALQSAWEGQASSIIENFTELGTGGNINKFLAKMANSKAGRAVGLGYISDLVGKIGATPFARNMKQFMERTHWDGMIEEPLEEEYGIILNSLLTGDNKVSDLWDSEQQADIFAGTMWFGGIMAGLNTAAYPFYRRKIKRELNRADIAGQKAFGDEWEVMKAGIDELDDKQIGDYLYGIKDNDSFSNDQKAALFAYVSRLKQQQGASVADMLMRMEGGLSKEETDVRNAYAAGEELTEPQDMNDAKNRLDIERAKLGEFATDMMMEEFDRNPVGALNGIIHNENWTDEEKQTAIDYVNARMTYDGMINSVRDDIDSQIAQSDATVDQRRNAEDMMVHPAMTKNGKQVYIINGSVVMNADGTAVDRDSTMATTGGDGMILAVDAETGEVASYSADDFESADAPIDADQLKQENAEAIRQTVAQQAADKIQGKLAFVPGETYTIMDEQGAEHSVQVFEDQGDGTVAVYIDGDPQVQVMAKDTIQYMSDAYNMQRVAAETEQPAEEPTSELTQSPSDQVSDQEEEEPATALSQIPVMQDQRGNQMRDKQGNPAYQWHMAPVETTSDALTEMADGDQLMARDTAGAMVNKAKADLEKARKLPVKGDDPITIMNSRKTNAQAVADAQAVVKYWQDVNQELQRRMTQASNERRAAEEAAKSAEQKAREAEEARIRQEKQAEIERERRREQIEKDRKERTRPYAPLERAKKEVKGDDYAASLLENVEPRDLQEWVSSLLRPHSLLWDNEQVGESTVTGLQSELGLQKKDFDRIGKLLATREEGGKPFAEVVDEIHEGLPEAMKEQYTDQDVRNTLLELFQEGDVNRMMHLTEEHRIEEAREAVAENERREAEAELDAWAEAYHLTPEERGQFEEYLEMPPTDIEEEIINQIIAEDEQNRTSEELDQQPVSGTAPRENAGGTEEIRGQGAPEEVQGDNGQRSDVNAEIPEAGAVVSDDNVSGGTSGVEIAPSEQLKPTDLRDAVRPESAELGVNEANARARYQLSATEKDAEGNSFFEKDGSIDLWSLPDLFAKAGRQNAPIRLTDRNLQHILDEHGREIGDADKVFDFLDDVFGNATVLRMARGRAMFVVVENDKTDKAAIIKLMPSETGDYYNVESAGYYRKNKWKENEDVIADLREPSQSDAATDVSKPQTPDENGGEPINAETQASSSEGKDTNNSANFQENQQKSSDLGKTSSPEEIAAEEAKVDTNPTEAQKEAGNYQKGHINVDGYDITIENPKGSVRRGTDASGKQWEQEMHNTYGYIRGTEGVDGDHIDVFLSDNPTGGNVFVVDQVNKDGSFDEHKVMYGFNSEEEARQAYLSNYEDGWQGLGAITEVSREEFKKWVESSHRKTKPFADYKSVKKEEPAEKPKAQEKIEDVGEVIEGARKDMRRKLAQTIASATKQTLTELPFSKAYKKPDLKKAVEDGALRESDATFYDAWFATMVNPTKPKVTQREMRMKKYVPDYRTSLEKWVDQTHDALQVLKTFVESSEEERDAMIGKLLDDKFPNREEQLAAIEKRKNRWSESDQRRINQAVASVTGGEQGNAAEAPEARWGDKTTPNPLWITYEVMKQLGYTPGDKVDIPYGIVEGNLSGTGYTLMNNKGERSYDFKPGTIEEAIDDIVYLARLKRGDTDIQHPVSMFYTIPTKSETGETGRYRVMYGSWNSPKSQDFDSREEADAFSQKKKGSVVSPIREIVRRFGYKVMYRHPLTGEKIAVNEREFDTKDEAKAYIEDSYDTINDDLNAILSKEKNSSGKSELKPDDIIYTAIVRGNDGQYRYAVLIDKKYANNFGMPLIIKEGFGSRDEAKAYADSVKDQLFNTYNSYKNKLKSFTFFSTGANTRRGEDYRGGRDVTAEDFMDTFGFRGVQFGNWTNQRDRQMAVNQAYDSFLDLANLIGVSPKALSLNGELGIAFGARGSGNFAAHYEPGEIVINLTKTMGAGSLAHEWWHALDNYFSRSAGQDMGMVTDDQTIPMRQELRDAYNTLLDQIKKSNYYTRSKGKGDYWGRMHEVTARLLAEWVDQELKKKGDVNTFLSRGANTENLMQINYERYKAHAELAGKQPMSFEDYKKLDEAMAGSAYPSAAEVERFSDAMRNIFDVMQERTDPETGKVALFRDDEEKEVRIVEPDDVEFANNQEFLDYAKEHFTDTVDGRTEWKSYTNKDSGNVIRLSSHGINKSISNKAVAKSDVNRKDHLKALSKLDEILEESILGEVHPDRNNDPNILEIQRYYGAVRLNGKVYRVKTTVKKVKENKGKVSNNQYSFEVQEIELIEKRPDDQEIRGSETADTSDISTNSITAAKLLNNLETSKFSDEKKQFREENKAEQPQKTENRTPAEQRKAEAFAQRQWRRAHEVADDTIAKLNMTDKVEVRETPEGLSGRYAKAKGWYDKDSGKVVIILSNHNSPADVMTTILHECVAHYGLRQLFGKNFDQFLKNVYDNASFEVRVAIADMAARQRANDQKYGRKQRTNEEYLMLGAEEYLAGLAEDTNFERAIDSGWFQKIKDWFIGMLGKVGLKGFDGELTDNELRYILWRSYQNLAEPGRYRNVFQQAEDIAMQVKLNVGNYQNESVRIEKNDGTDTGQIAAETDNGLFKDEENNDEGNDDFGNIDTGKKTIEEIAIDSLVEISRKNPENVFHRVQAIQAIGGNLSKLRQAAAKQRAYDKETVYQIVRLAKTIMDYGGVDSLTRGEVKRLVGYIAGAAGKEDINTAAKNVVNLLIDNVLRQLKNLLNKQLSIRGTKIDKKGVEVQGQLDVEGARIAKALKEGMFLTIQSLKDRMDDCMQRMTDGDETVSKNAAAEYQGYMLALQYIENVKQSEEDEANLKNELVKAKEDYKAGRMTKEQYEELVDSIEDTIFTVKLERIENYRELMRNVSEGLNNSVLRAKEWREQQVQHANEIRHNANSDLEGTPVQSQGKLPEGGIFAGNANNDFLRLALAPLATFEKMMRYFGHKAYNGEGYLFNRFVRGWVDAVHNYWTNKKQAENTLDAKASEVFGRKMRWSDIFELERDKKKFPDIPVEYWDNGERVSDTITQGEAMYIYMVEKMADGRMKLRRMGITEEDVTAIKNHLDPKLIELADWVQNVFLKQKRNDYNKIHERVTGATMAAIENYFPLVINKRDLTEDKDITERDTGETTPSTITGSIIKRTKNAKPLKIHTDAFDVVLQHIDKMEHWAAFAELNRDLNILRNYTAFRNKVMNLSSTEFGAGAELWKNFENVLAIAADVYHPSTKRNSGDILAVNIAKGVTTAKIAFRLFTAIKQLQSISAFWDGSASLPELVKSSLNPTGAWQWAIDNLPGFSKRWQSRQSGDVRLIDTDSDYAFWSKKWIRKINRAGMFANAGIDGLTCAMGAKAVYETKKKGYLDIGYPKEQAEHRALQDAAIAYNNTQQSSENAFLSSLQLDRTWLSTLLTVFRTASMGYTRRMTTALRNLKYRTQEGYKEESIGFMKKMLERDGIASDKAESAATRVYNRGIYRSLWEVFMFGFFLPFTWNLLPYAAYLIGGDDDDEKEKMLEDAARHALLGPVEGLAGGNAVSELGNTLMSKESLRDKELLSMPITSDIKRIFSSSDKVAAANDVFNLLMQNAVGANPQTATDIYAAIMDYSNADPETSMEMAMLIMRVLQFPQDAMTKLMLDEIGMTEDEQRNVDPEKLAQRYALYKRRKNAPLTGWAYSNEQDMDVEKKHVQRFEKLLKERIDNKSDDELKKLIRSEKDEYLKGFLENEFVGRNEERLEKMDVRDMKKAFDGTDDPLERKVLAKGIAKRVGASEDSYGKNSSSEYAIIYQRIRTAEDVREDAELLAYQEDAQNQGQDALAKEISAKRKKIRDIVRGKHTQSEDIPGLGEGDDADVMRRLRKERHAYRQKLWEPKRDDRPGDD